MSSSSSSSPPSSSSASRVEVSNDEEKNSTSALGTQQSTPLPPRQGAVVQLVLGVIRNRDRRRCRLHTRGKAKACVPRRAISEAFVGRDLRGTWSVFESVWSGSLHGTQPREYDLTKRQKKLHDMAKVMNAYLHSNEGSCFPLKIDRIKIGAIESGEHIEHPRRTLLHASVKKVMRISL